MKREVREKKKELLEKSLRLKELIFDENLDYDKQQEIKEQQDDAYKRFHFYKNMLKATDKLNSKEVK